jgi:hypothetical protein
LGAGLDGLALQFLGLAQHLGFQMAEVLIARGDELLGRLFQVDCQLGRHHRQRTGTMRPATRTDRSGQAGCIHGGFFTPPPSDIC